NNLPTEADGNIPKAEALRFPAKYLANLLTAGDEKPIISALQRLLAMRSNQRSKAVDGTTNIPALEAAGLTEAQSDEMYQMLGIANYEDRFVIPTSHQEMQMDDPYAFQGQNGFMGGNASSHGDEGGKGFTLFPAKREQTFTPQDIQRKSKKS
ncbi:MAG: nitrate reductase subunit beta, partial [Gammaproteobacteria bacterium]|nr:nitrate reductase subunit beta [Gammaproteobacteria bacterium]